MFFLNIPLGIGFFALSGKIMPFGIFTTQIPGYRILLTENKEQRAKLRLLYLTLLFAHCSLLFAHCSLFPVPCSFPQTPNPNPHSPTIEKTPQKHYT